MNNVELLKILCNSSQGEFFEIEIPISTKEEEVNIKTLATELERNGKIKIRQCIEREYSGICMQL